MASTLSVVYLSRRSAVLFGALLGLSGGWLPAAEPTPWVAVLYPEASAPFQQIFSEIVAGIAEDLGDGAMRTLAVPVPSDPVALRRWLDRPPPEAAITLGRVPTEAFERLGSVIPQVIGALDASPQTRPDAAGVSLSVEPALLFQRLKLLFPGVRRVWVVYNPATDRWLIDLANDVAAAYDLRVLAFEASDLRGAAFRFLEIFKRVEPSTDALWLLADASLVDPQTVLPMLVEKAWQQRLALFSNSLLQTKQGTLFGLYPNNVQLGRRLGELARARARARGAGGRPRVEPLRAVKSVLNLKIAAHLELRITHDVERQFDVVLPPW